MQTVEVQPDEAFDICPRCESVADDDGQPVCNCAKTRESPSYLDLYDFFADMTVVAGKHLGTEGHDHQSPDVVGPEIFDAIEETAKNRLALYDALTELVANMETPRSAKATKAWSAALTVLKYG